MIFILQILVYIFYIYLLVGLIFAFWFAIKGAQKIDDGMKGVHWALRLMIFPGAIALWPILIKKIRTSN